MATMLRLLLLPGVLFAGASFALAESPMPDPIAPAVIGRPFGHMQQTRPAQRKPVAAKPAHARSATAKRPTAHAKLARKTAPATQAMGAAPAHAPAGAHGPKQAVDDRADPRMRLDDVGKGTHFARKPLGTGAYIGDKSRDAVLKYYQEHPSAGTAANWKVGEPVPRGAALASVPPGLLASLPQLPPGHRYVELGGEVVMIAAGSRVVVDGISRGPR